MGKFKQLRMTENKLYLIYIYLRMTFKAIRLGDYGDPSTTLIRE